MLKAITISLITIFMLFFGLKYTQEHQAAENAATILSTTEPSMCEAFGGKVKQVCMSQKLACVVPYSDAGNECKSSSECEGRCVNIGARKGFKGKGQCDTSNNPCGCWEVVEKGNVHNRYCVD